MAKNLGEKIVCHKCKTKFYTMGKNYAPCPKCHKDNIIPEGSDVLVKLNIRPGGYNDFKLGWTDGIASEGKAGAIYLNCEFSVLSPPHIGKKFFSLIGLHSPKGPWWGKKGRELIRSILNSSNDIDDQDKSVDAMRVRRLKTLKDLNDTVFRVKVKVIKGTDGWLKNELDTVIVENNVVENSDVKNKVLDSIETYSGVQNEVTYEESVVKPMWMR
tara:strand:- start:1454 stop:2098 length:645 start_codon:yes stop_codon:yes gene_type:complete